MVPPPVAVTVTMALTSRPPSGRYSFWYTSTENCGTFDLEKLAIWSAPWDSRCRMKTAVREEKRTKAAVTDWAVGTGIKRYGTGLTRYRRPILPLGAPRRTAAEPLLRCRGPHRRAHDPPAPGRRATAVDARR